MMKIQAKPITPESWILFEYGNRVGTLSWNNQQWCLFKVNKLSSYDKIEDLERELDWKIEFQQQEIKEEAVVDHIDNWPVRHTNPQNIQKDPVIAYTKTAASTVYFAAGYWIILFANGWSPSFCPKQDTLTKYPTMGPFQTKLEMQTVLNQKNKEYKKA